MILKEKKALSTYRVLRKSITTATIREIKVFMFTFCVKSRTGAVIVDLFTGVQVFPFTVGPVELINNKINPKVEL